MTVEPTYLIPSHVVHTHEGDHPMQEAMCLRCMLDLHIADGELVLDTTTQAIKDAPLCEHGRIDEHKFRLICYHVNYKACRESARCWCDGALELRALLDTLTKEE